MYRKVLAVLFFMFVSVFALSAQSDEWYWNQPISKIDFNGLKNVKKSDLGGITSSFINSPFTDEVYNELLDRLYSLEYFEDITPYAKHASNDSTDVLLVFEVVERPVIKSITFTGNRKIRNGELREQIKNKASDIYIESKVLIDERIIRNYYLKKGFNASYVTHSTEKTPEGIIVNFEISEGSSSVIREIQFSGNSIVSTRALKRKLALKEVGLFKDGAYQPSTLEQDKQTIIKYYQERGYADITILDVKVDSAFNEEKQRDELTILFLLQEGAQYTYSGLRISGNEVFTEKELLKQKKLREGQIYNATKFQEDLQAVAGVYQENGYMTNEYYPVPVKDSDRHEISYDLTIKEHSRSHVENIIIKGNSKTKDYVIRREVPLKSGDTFSNDKIINGLRNLMNLRYFSNVVPEAQAGTEDNLIDLILSVEEQSTSSVQFGVTFSGATESASTIPISLFAKVENSNLFGEGRTISAATTIAPNEQSVDFSYSQNWIGDYPISFNTSLSLSHAKNSNLVNFWSPNLELVQNKYYMNYHDWSTTLSSGVSRRWTPDYAILTLAGGISTSLQKNVYDESVYVPVETSVSSYANRWGISNAIYASFSVDNRDVNYDPSKGWFMSERLTWHGLIPKLEKEFYARTDTKLEGYFKLFDIPVTESWSFKMVFAAYTGFSAIIPVENGISTNSSIYIDGLINGRGWSESYKETTGLAMLSNKIELRMPIIPGVIGIDAFWDAAAVKPKIQDAFSYSPEDFYFSYGPGIRFLIPQLPLHLLFAWRYRIVDGKPKFADRPFNFVLSFNIVNY